MAQKIHTSVRLSESEKKFLDDHDVSVLRAARIGIMSLKYAAQSDSPCVLYYVPSPVSNPAPPAGPWHQEPDPTAHAGSAETVTCCKACPIRNAMPKRIHAALQPEQKDVMIDQEPDPGSIITLRDLVVVHTENIR